MDPEEKKGTIENIDIGLKELMTKVTKDLF